MGLRKIPSEYVDAVARGAALLDKKKPGWARKVDMRTFTMLYPDTCTLAQCFGTYEQGRQKLKLDDKQSGDLGFSGRIFEFFIGHELLDLNGLWRKAILKRRKDRGFRR